MKVSVLILTFNEERNIGPCLEALAWCNDILVLDSGSTDRTVEIAQSRGARILHNPFKCFADQRNFGLEHGQFRYEWVLHLDADEIVTPEFRKELAMLDPPEGIDAWTVPSQMMLFGRWIRHAGMYPTYQVRLGHRDRLRFVQIGHGQREDLPENRIATFAVPYLHYCFSHGLFGWFTKHVRYARDEAALILELRRKVRSTERTAGAMSRRRMAKSTAARIPVLLRPLLRFIYIYVLKQGFRDGRAGFIYAVMLSIYEGITAIFVIESTMRDNTIPIAGSKNIDGCEVSK